MAETQQSSTNGGDSLEARDRQIVLAAREACGADLRPIMHGLTAFMHGLGELSESGRWTQVSELLRVVLLVRCFNSLNLSYRALETGYHVQSFMLLRASFEDWTAEAYVIAHPDQVNRWIAPNLRPPNRAKLLNTVDKADRKKIQGTLRTLDDFVHPRQKGVWQIVDPPEEAPNLRLGSHLDLEWTRLVVYPFLYLISLSLGSVNRLFGELGIDAPPKWVQEANAFDSEAADWSKGFDTRHADASPEVPITEPENAEG
jgi:hypothetical protein